MSIGFAVLIAIGLWTVLDPSAAEGFQGVGRRSGLKQLVANYWGTKLGVSLIVLGAIALVGLHTQKGD